MTQLQKAQATAKVITANKALFKQGATFDAAWLIANMQTAVPKLAKRASAVKRNVQLMEAYCLLNRFLHQDGLHIKAKNYYTTFEILSKEDTIKKIKRYQTVARQKANTAITLTSGIARTSCKLTRVTKKTIATVISK